METKSRYEVIADLEARKRDLIKERDSFSDALEKKKKDLRELERTKQDNIMVFDRKMADVAEDIEKFEKDIGEKKETVKELIASVDASLARFGELAAKQK